jgi:hypothetical protein
VWNYSAGVISPANNSDDDTVVVGTTTMSGSGEMVRAYCDPGEGENIGFLANDDDTDFIGGVFTGFLAKGINTTAFSNQFTGFQVDAPTAGFLGAIGYGFVCSDMAGTGLSGMTAFYQVGVNEVNEFRGSSGFGGGASGSMAVRAQGISSAFTNVQAYRNVNNTTSSPGPDWTAFDAYIVQPFVATAHYIRDVWFYKVTSPASSVAVTIRNAYGLYIEDLQADADFTYTNPPYGIYQAGSGEGNFLNGNTGVGTQPTVGHKLRVSGDVYMDGGQVGLGTAPDASIRLKVSGDAWITDDLIVDDQAAIGGSLQADSQVYIAKTWAPGSSQTLRTILEVTGGYNDSGFTLQDLPMISAEATVTAGTVTELFGVKVYSPSVSGIVSTGYGVFLEAQDVSGVGTGYGIYQQGSADNNYFAGDVGIGVIIPAYTLDVDGSANLRSGGSLRLNGSASGVATLTADADASQVDCTQDLNLSSSKVIRINGTQVLTSGQAMAAMSTTSDGSQDGTARVKINDIIAALKVHGIFV